MDGGERRRRLVQALALLPWLLAAWVGEVGATRALVLAWVVECGAPGRLERHALPAFLLRHLPLWLLLHLLGPDAAAWLGALLLLALAASLPWWGCGSWPGSRRLRPALVLVVFAPLLLSFCLRLSGRMPPGWLVAVDLWRRAGPAAAPATPGAPPVELPPGTSLADLDLRLPPRLWPWPLEEGPGRARARLLVGAALLVQILALLLPGRRRLLLQAAGWFVVAAGWSLAREPSGIRLHWRDRPGAVAGRLLEVHGAGAGLWDPLRGRLLPASAPMVIRSEAREGLFQVVSAGPWAVVRELPGGAEAPPGAAWLVLRPLAPPRSGGPAAEEGGLAILRLWAAGDPGAPGGVRWSLSEDGRTLWREPLAP